LTIEATGTPCLTPRMILCAGLQSGGTTLISWCFLQRRDTNGVLDTPSDLIQPRFERVREPIVWVKQTVVSFRWLDLCETYQDLGWEPEPLLVVRDVRAAYSSLIRKSYGVNGTTAEDPPLRMRFRRFLSDWEIFRAHGWPIIKFEDLIRDHRATLMQTCKELSLPWDEGMISWPKEPSEIAYNKDNWGKKSIQKSFEGSIQKGNLAAATMQDRAEMRLDNLPGSELRWLEETFSDYNSFHHYPDKVRHTLREDTPASMPSPRYQGTAREWYHTEMDKLSCENWRLISENERLRQQARA
jgi:hypothetical protein